MLHKPLFLAIFIWISGLQTVFCQVNFSDSSSVQIAPTLKNKKSSAFHQLLIQTSNSIEFEHWVNAHHKDWIVNKSGNNLYNIRAPYGNLDSVFRGARGIKFADRDNRVARVETVLGESDFSLNTVTATHSVFPLLDGGTGVVSIKEKPFDVEDIDLRGRIVLNEHFDEPGTLHATFMATLAAGGGNTSRFAKGAAWGAQITSSDFNRLLPDDGQSLTTLGVTVQNHSYGVGIENYYGIESSEYDRESVEFPKILHVFSSGNEGDKSDSEGFYSGLTGFANITGQFKVSKNTISVGSSDRFGHVDMRSSRGPAHDGRIKPELIAFGDAGSSESAAVVSGISLLIQEAYHSKYGELPDAALVKAILINSAKDSGRPHVDFETGYGNVNALSSIRTIESGHFITSTVHQNEEKNFLITIPANQHQLKITLVWADPPADPFASKALINDLDLTLYQQSSSTVWNPWILNSAATPEALSEFAYRGIDRVNNVEQVTLDLPNGGTYEIRVKGHSVQQSPQKFFIAYEFVEGFEWLNPISNSPFPSNSETIIRWSWNKPEEIGQLEFRFVSEQQWHILESELTLSQSYYKLQTLDTAALIQLKISTSTESFESTFFPISKPDRLQVGFNCEDEVMLLWNRVPAATSYQLYFLGDTHLEPLLTTTDTFAIVSKSQIDTRYFSASPIFNSLPGVKELTINYEQQGTGCYFISFTPNQYLVSEIPRFNVVLGTNYNLQSIILERFEAGVFKSVNTLSPVPGKEFLIDDPSPQSGIFTYRAKLITDDNEILISNESEILFAQKDDLFVYPNPITRGEELRVVVNNEDAAIIRLYDLHGRLIRGIEEVGAVRTIDTSDLKSGIYLLRVYKKDGSILLRKLIAQ